MRGVRLFVRSNIPPSQCSILHGFKALEDDHRESNAKYLVYPYTLFIEQHVVK
jgi:hypothetical protein